jgi:hypothetical protein
MWLNYTFWITFVLKLPFHNENCKNILNLTTVGTNYHLNKLSLCQPSPQSASKKVKMDNTHIILRALGLSRPFDRCLIMKLIKTFWFILCLRLL